MERRDETEMPGADRSSAIDGTKKCRLQALKQFFDKDHAKEIGRLQSSLFCDLFVMLHQHVLQFVDRYEERDNYQHLNLQQKTKSDASVWFNDEGPLYREEFDRYVVEFVADHLTSRCTCKKPRPPPPANLPAHALAAFNIVHAFPRAPRCRTDNDTKSRSSAYTTYVTLKRHRCAELVERAVSARKSIPPEIVLHIFSFLDDDVPVKGIDEDLGSRFISDEEVWWIFFMLLHRPPKDVPSIGSRTPWNAALDSIPHITDGKQAYEFYLTRRMCVPILHGLAIANSRLTQTTTFLHDLIRAQQHFPIHIHCETILSYARVVATAKNFAARSNGEHLKRLVQKLVELNPYVFSCLVDFMAKLLSPNHEEVREEWYHFRANNIMRKGRTTMSPRVALAVLEPEVIDTAVASDPQLLRVVPLSLRTLSVCRTALKSARDTPLADRTEAVRKKYSWCPSAYPTPNSLLAHVPENILAAAVCQKVEIENAPVVLEDATTATSNGAAQTAAR
ncbi:unnamed protein product [Amoebophrya sp. A120]|nr:unnamed protein product [Amoebophrya sp. A120]|eukprot:GSA120T00001700001.1